jgi:hypothetical protein
MSMVQSPDEAVCSLLAISPVSRAAAAFVVVVVSAELSEPELPPPHPASPQATTASRITIDPRFVSLLSII